MKDVPDRNPLEALRIERSARDAASPWGRRVLLLGIAVGLVGTAAWWFLSGAQAVEVSAATVREAQTGAAPTSVLDASGYVVARRQATVSSKITGRLLEVAIEEGTVVKAAQTLARLDDANARQALALAEAQSAAAATALKEIEVLVRQAETDLRRTRDLVGKGIESQAALDQELADRDSLAARLEAARANVTVAGREVAVRRQDMEDTLIRAPFDGVVVSKDAQPGEIVSPMSAGGGFTRTGIGTIVDMSSLEIEVDVNEAFIQRVRPNQPVQAMLQAYPDWKIPARVITTVPTADRQKATVKVRIAFDQLGDPRLLPDMGVRVAFQAESDGAAAQQRPRLLVPERALRREKDGGVVFVVRDDRIERRAVAVGGMSDDHVEVRSGLRAGERIVLDPPADLSETSRVRVRP